MARCDVSFNGDVSPLAGFSARILSISHIDEDVASFILKRLIIEVEKQLNEKKPPLYLFGGLAGFALLYDQYCYLLDEEDRIENTNQLDQLLSHYADNCAKSIEFDFLYGSVGIWRYLYFKYQNTPHLIHFINDYIKSVKSNVKNLIGSPRNEFGMAHGICALFQLNNDILSSEVQVGGHSDLAIVQSQLAKFILSKEVVVQGYSKYPDFIDGTVSEHSAPRWCRGDIPIAISLAKYAKWSQNKTLMGRAHSCLLGGKVMTIEQHEDLKMNPFFCHGSIGVCYLYYNAYLIFEDDQLLKISEYWLNRCLDQLEKMISPYPPGILTGIDGIFLALKDITTRVEGNWNVFVNF